MSLKGIYKEKQLSRAISFCKKNAPEQKPGRQALGREGLLGFYLLAAPFSICLGSVSDFQEGLLLEEASQRKQGQAEGSTRRGYWHLCQKKKKKKVSLGGEG